MNLFRINYWPLGVCDLCGDTIIDNWHQITQAESDEYVLDTGTFVHSECAEMSKPTSTKRREEEEMLEIMRHTYPDTMIFSL